MAFLHMRESVGSSEAQEPFVAQFRPSKIPGMSGDPGIVHPKLDLIQDGFLGYRFMTLEFKHSEINWPVPFLVSQPNPFVQWPVQRLPPWPTQSAKTSCVPGGPQQSFPAEKSGFGRRELWLQGQNASVLEPRCTCATGNWSLWRFGTPGRGIRHQFP